MTTFSSTKYTSQNLGKSPLASPAGFSKTVHREYAVVVVPNTLAINDVLNFFVVPKGARIVDAWLICDDMDSGGPTLTIDVGDGDGAATIFSASAAGGTGAIDRNPVHAAFDKQYSVDTLIFGTIHAAATTKVAGNIALMMLMDLTGLTTS